MQQKCRKEKAKLNKITLATLLKTVLILLDFSPSYCSVATAVFQSILSVTL